MPDPNQTPSLQQTIFLQAQQHAAQNKSAPTPNVPYPELNIPSVPAFIGGQYVQADPNTLANLKEINPDEDMAKIMKYMPQTPAGPYGNAAGEDVTSKMYQQQMASPYVTGIAQKLGVNHPRLASVVDNAMLGISGAEAAHEQATAAGRGAGFGAGLASLVAGATAPGQAQLARREQLEETRLGYQTQEAQLQNLRAEGLKNTLSALAQYEMNPAKELSMYGRGAIASAIAAQARERVAQGQNLSKEFIALENDQTKFQIALDSDASKQHIAQWQERYKTARNDKNQILKIYADFSENVEKANTAIRLKYATLKNTPTIGPGGIPQAKSPDEIAVLDDSEQRELQMEQAYAEHASQTAFGQHLNTVLGDHISGQMTPTPSKESKPKTQPPATQAAPSGGHKVGDTIVQNGHTFKVTGVDANGKVTSAE